MLAGRVKNALGVEALEAVAEHGAVFFDEDVQADLDDVVGGNTQEVAVEGGVVEFAEGQTVFDRGDPLGIAIGEDVGGVEELGVAQATGWKSRATGQSWDGLELMRPMGPMGPMRPP